MPAPVNRGTAGACGNCNYVGWAYVGDLEPGYVFGAATPSDQATDLERQLLLIFKTAVLAKVLLDIGVSPLALQAQFGVIAELATHALVEARR